MFQFWINVSHKQKLALVVVAYQMHHSNCTFDDVHVHLLLYVDDVSVFGDVFAFLLLQIFSIKLLSAHTWKWATLSCSQSGQFLQARFFFFSVPFSTSTTFLSRLSSLPKIFVITQHQTYILLITLTFCCGCVPFCTIHAQIFITVLFISNIISERANKRTFILSREECLH